MKVELNDEERERVVKEVAKLVYSYLHENFTIRAVISQEIKAYFDEEKRIKEAEKKKRKNENDNEDNI